MKKRPINWKTDPKTWLSHTLWMIAVWVFLGTLFYNSAIGVTIASMVIYLREVSQNNWVFEYWRWDNWDSIFDFVIPIVILGLLFNFLTPAIIWSLIL